MRVLVVLALLTSAIAVPRDPQRIVGGRNTFIEQYPFLSNMQYLWDGVIWWTSCGGSLITTTSILSAAHCYDFSERFSKKRFREPYRSPHIILIFSESSDFWLSDMHRDDFPWEWRVRLGSTFMSSGGTLHAISAFVLHERYHIPTRLDNDVAIVRLASPAVLSPAVGVARIGGANYLLPDNTPVTAVGWGELWNLGPQPEILQHVDIYTINQEICVQRYAYLRTQPGFQNWPEVTSNMLCSGVLDVGGRDACSGDSGGPLLHQGDVIVGITSWGYDCAHNFYPGVNARPLNWAKDWGTPVQRDPENFASRQVAVPIFAFKWHSKSSITNRLRLCSIRPTRLVGFAQRCSISEHAISRIQ
ncbi:Trypsin, alkaline C [Eumeta japonica]|uniref:Trypsin, alkaline C n=1 Tax=Eumeta variegata TaxID=151549 RepID=A0A4C1SF71_EUMVA|nr:Trypsin, alkaline C [Eumeta japonica]